MIGMTDVSSTRTLGVICMLVLGGWGTALAQTRAGLPAPILAEADTVYGQVGDWFVLRGIDGTAIDFDDLRGRPLFINFWATWCPPCIREMPTIVDLMHSVGEYVTVLLISVDNDDRDVQRYLRKHGLSVPVYFRDWQPGQSTFPARMIPATFVVDAEGSIIYQHHGAADWSAAAFRAKLDEWTARGSTSRL